MCRRHATNTFHLANILLCWLLEKNASNHYFFLYPNLFLIPNTYEHNFNSKRYAVISTLFLNNQSTYFLTQGSYEYSFILYFCSIIKSTLRRILLTYFPYKYNYNLFVIFLLNKATFTYSIP